MIFFWLFSYFLEIAFEGNKKTPNKKNVSKNLFGDFEKKFPRYHS